MSEKDKYFKNDAHAEERLPLKTELKPKKNTARKRTTIVHESYTKQDGTLSAALFIIISGGTKRERDYFAKIADIKTFPRIDLRFISRNKETGEEGLSPDKLFNLAKSIKKQIAENETSDTDDSIYIVTDVDEFQSIIIELLPLCKNEKFNLIISNSCFEVWLYYGKIESVPSDFVIPSKISKISSAFKKYLDDKFKGGIDPRKSIFEIQTATINSRLNYEEDENGIPKLFSTNMFLLAEKLLALIENELQYLKEKGLDKTKIHKK